jgi:hypothetical protein
VALGELDAMVRRTVELARARIGLARAAIFLVDGARQLMLGTWGTDLQGAIVDEHHVMYDVSDTDREAFRRAQADEAHMTPREYCAGMAESG